MKFFAVAASFVASVAAIQVTYPATGTNWTQVGPNTLSWTSVNTDPTAFRVLLVNPDFSVNEELAANVQTSLGTLQVQAPSSGFPLGQMWRINFEGLDNTQNSAAILAQSGYFNITNANGGTTTTGVTPTTATVAPTVTPASNPTVSAAANPAGTTTVDSLNPSTPVSGASGFFQVSSALLALVATVHAFVL